MMADRVYDATSPLNAHARLRSHWALVIGARQCSALGLVSGRWSLKAPACPAKCLPGAILASEAARCDSGKSVKETDTVEKLQTNKAKAAFWARRQMETLGNQAESTNKQRHLQQQQ